MTASKSSRARNARAQRSQGAQAGAARNGNATRMGTAVKTPAPVKASPAVKTGAVKDGAVRNVTAVKADTGVRAGTVVRAGGQGGSAELAATGSTSWTVPLWLQLVTFGFALGGLGVSIYLTIAHFTESTLLGCSETSGLVNCTKVTTSPQSYVFGIPVAVLGLAFYLFAAVIMSPWAWRWARREVYLLRIASTVVGIGFVIYLIYAELFIIGSICLYCTSVHAITFILFGLTAFAAAAWGLPERQRG